MAPTPVENKLGCNPVWNGYFHEMKVMLFCFFAHFLVSGVRQLAPAIRWQDAFSGSGRGYSALVFWKRNFTESASHPLLGQKRTVEDLWKDFFSDPSQWWDHRLEKGNAKYPDFKHKKTNEALWLNSRLKPGWVEAKMAAIAPGTIQANIFPWNIRLARYVKAEQFGRALSLFQQMQQNGMTLDSFTFVSILSACAGLQAIEDGRHVHTQVKQRGLESDVFVSNSLLNMYAKCGSIEDAWSVFIKMPTRDVVVWNAMILAFVKCGQGQQALELFRQMQREEVKPDSVTFVGVLNACASTVALDEGRAIHVRIMQSGWLSNVFVGNSLVDMYMKCGKMEDAWTVFNMMPTHNVVSWNAIILGHVKFGLGRKALELFWQMQQDGVKPDNSTFVAVLNACSSLAALEEGRNVHQQVIQSGCKPDVFVCNSLIDMYAKCGSSEDAREVFNKMPYQSVVSWNTMLGGYALHGYPRECLGLVECMHQGGVQMDTVTFVSILSACSRAGLVDEGLQYFEYMGSVHGISATMEHYTCVVDLLSRAGRLCEAGDLIQQMPYKPDITLWMSFVGACRVHGNLEMGEGIVKRFLGLHPG